MVYNTQNHWVSGLCPSFSILKATKHNVLETEPVSDLFWGGRERERERERDMQSLLDPLERDSKRGG
jgi:hypothetical protein